MEEETNTLFYRPSIAVDLDGVLANLEAAVIKQIQVKFDQQPAENLYKQFYVHDRYDTNKKKIKEFVAGNECFGAPGFWESLKTYAESLQELKRWYDAYYVESIHIMTGRREEARIGTKKFLDKNTIPHATLFMASKGVKGKLMTHIGASILIEDRYDEAVLAAELGHKVYLIDYPYNEDYKDLQNSENIIWVKNFKEIGEIEFE